MERECTFTTRPYPTNDLYELDLQNHLDQMIKVGWRLVCTQQLITETSQTPQRIVLFWSKE